MPINRPSHTRRNRSGERCIVKSIKGHWRLRNEAEVLKRYQSETPFLRPLVDEEGEPADPPSIVLRYLDSDVLTESNKKRLSRPEIKQVARCVLEALRVLHRDGMVHTGGQTDSSRPLRRRLLNHPDVKLDNIFVNYGHSHGQSAGCDERFSEVQLGDCGGVVSQQSPFVKEGQVIGAAFTRSPEATFQLLWNTATDIWSFGTAVRWMILPPPLLPRHLAR
jgi:serine/threonine protein kinase